MKILKSKRYILKMAQQWQGDQGVTYMDSDVQFYYVSIYESDRQFGGKEEGGWFYSNYRYTGESYSFETEEEANQFAREKNNEFNTLKENKVAKVEEYPGENETTQRPYYE